MSDTARDYSKIETASIEGLENFFDEGLPGGLPAELPRGLPAEEAAIKLGLTIRAVLKRLRRGTLKGYKSPTKHGEKWFVLSTELPAELPVQVEGLPFENVGAPSCNVELLHEDPFDSLGVPSESQKFFEILGDLQTKLDVANNQLQAASFRNGYLEAQLEVERQQVKLLTDSQHKAPWWHGAWQWFFGSRT
jgi:hypothetical protein